MDQRGESRRSLRRALPEKERPKMTDFAGAKSVKETDQYWRIETEGPVSATTPADMLALKELSLPHAMTSIGPDDDPMPVLDVITADGDWVLYAFKRSSFNEDDRDAM